MCLATNGSIPTFVFAILTSFSTNLVYGPIFKGYILDTSSSVGGIVSICSSSQVIYGSSVCTSSSWAILQGLASTSSSLSDAFVLVGLP